MLNSHRQIPVSRMGVRFRHRADVVSLQRLDHAFRHAVTLRAADRRGYRLEADFSRKPPSIGGNITRTIVAQPFHLRRNTQLNAALFHRFQHNVSNHVTRVATGRGCPTDDFTVAAVLRKDNAQLFAIITAKLEAIRAPAAITGGHSNAPLMPARDTRWFEPPLEQQTMLTHDAINALHVDRWQVTGLSLSANQSPRPAVAVAGQRRNGGLDLFDQLAIIGRSTRTTIASINRTRRTANHVRARQPERSADRGYWSSPGNKGERAIHFFVRAMSTASLRISFSIVFLPRSRCSSRICLMADANSEAGTTSSPAAMLATM